MHGQWSGDFAGTNSGVVTLDLDDLGEGAVSGVAYAIDRSLPCVKVHIPAIPIKPEQTIVCDIEAVDVMTNERLSPAAMEARFGKVAMPMKAELDVRWDGDTITIHWRTALGTNGYAVLTRSLADQPSALTPHADIQTWDDFRAFAVKQPANKFLYRGQIEPFRLRTKFHRSSRKSLDKFDNFDVPVLQTALVSRTTNFLRIDNGQTYAAFLHLLQHHGYPTPLLDWTLSPFVAAYFAFAECRDPHPDKKVRIFMFDRAQWTGRFEQVFHINSVRRHFTVIQPMAIENERAVPQQALATVTNIDDIETYLAERQPSNGPPLLQVFDLPFAERTQVRNELRLMGITPASMFPGIEGICDSMRRLQFGHIDDQH